MSITLEQAKQHLRVDSSDEDSKIQDDIDAAWLWILRYIKSDGSDLTANDLTELQAAQRLLVGEWYHNREATTERSANEAPFAVRAICGPFRTPTIA